MDKFGRKYRWLMIALIAIGTLSLIAFSLLPLFTY